MTLSEFIKNIIIEENDAGCYDVKIGNILAYSLIRQNFRTMIAKQHGLEMIHLTGNVNRNALLSLLTSTLQSFWQMTRLFFRGKKYPVVFLPFARIEKINGVYIDKFTDPLIDVVNFKTPYVILETGRMGTHYTPRAHKKNVINIDFVRVLATILSIIGYGWFKNKYKNELSVLMKSLYLLSKGNIEKRIITKQLLLQYAEIYIFIHILKRLNAKLVISPARPTVGFIACHLVGAKAYELQHGITYGETILYSGFRDKMLLPDYFLAFGNNKPIGVYGIDECKIINIGWAMHDYLSVLKSDIVLKKKEVLVVSGPGITNTIINVVVELANTNKDVMFAIRPHPNEVVCEDNLKKISKYPNIYIQNNKINISEALMSFEFVVGENSTVLYEALSMKKKVGKLFFKGLSPQYLISEDKELFWEIHNQENFREFLQEEQSRITNRCIYSKFNKDLFLNTIGLKNE